MGLPFAQDCDVVRQSISRPLGISVKLEVGVLRDSFVVGSVAIRVV